MSKTLTVLDKEGGLIHSDNIEFTEQHCKQLIKTGILPKEYVNPHQVMTMVSMCRNLQLDPVMAMNKLFYLYGRGENATPEPTWLLYNTIVLRAGHDIECVEDAVYVGRDGKAISKLEMNKLIEEDGFDALEMRTTIIFRKLIWTNKQTGEPIYSEKKHSVLLSDLCKAKDVAIGSDAFFKLQEWKNPRAMLWARGIGQGSRRYFSNLLISSGVNTYTVDETIEFEKRSDEFEYVAKQEVQYPQSK